MASPIQTIPIRSPGSLGLVADVASPVEDPRYALELLNAVINDSGRVASRNGWSMQTITGNHGEDTNVIHEFVVDSSTTKVISVADVGIYEGTTTLTDVTNTATVATNDWSFLNFNGKSIGFGAGEQPIQWNGTGAGYADISAASGTAPQSNIAVATHGRLFAFDSDKQTIQFSGLLDETDWGGTGAGSLDMSNVWPVGLDVGVALVEWNDYLAVFGERSVVLFTGLSDPGNTTTGLKLAGSGTFPTAGGVDDMLTIDGAVSREAVVSIGTDLIYLSRSGLRSLKRGLVHDKLPLRSIGEQIRQALVTDVASALSGNEPIRMVYHRPINAIIARVGASKWWYFDVRNPNQIRASVWEGIGWLSAASIGANLYLGQNDGIGLYTGAQDNGSSYVFRWLSPWLQPAQGRVFVPKRAQVFMANDGDQTVTMRWAWDYNASLASEGRFVDVGTLAEYNTASTEYGIAEYGPKNALARKSYSMGGHGSVMQVGTEAVIDGGGIEIQQIDLMGKVGRVDI